MFIISPQSKAIYIYVAYSLSCFSSIVLFIYFIPTPTCLSQNAAYLASKKGLDIVGSVTTALRNATFDKQSTQSVLIQSDDTSVLSKFKSVPTYQRVLYIEEKVGDAPKQSVEEVKKYADAVAVTRATIIEVTDFFTTGFTSVVEEFQKANISVYVYVLRNEYITLAFDYFSDPMVEIATFVTGIGVDGIITEYPGTASNYISMCSYNLKFY